MMVRHMFPKGLGHHALTSFSPHKNSLFLAVFYHRGYGASSLLSLSSCPLSSFLEGLMGQPPRQANLSWCGVPEDLQCIE